MRCLIFSILLAISSVPTAIAKPTQLDLILKGVQLIDAADTLSSVVSDAVDLGDDAVIELFAIGDIKTYYGNIITGNEFHNRFGFVVGTLRFQRRNILLPVR